MSTPTLTPAVTNMSIMLVSPEQAATWLERDNLENRRIRPVWVTALAEDIAAGRWQMTGDPIKFDTNGLLLDGQHRLSAIAKSGETVPLYVVRDLPPEARSVIDTGLSRTASDAMLFSGLKNTANLASVARIAIARDLGYYTTGYETRQLPKLTNSRIVEYVQEHPDLPAAVEFSISIGRRLPAQPISGWLYAVWQLEQVDFDAAHEFVTSISEARLDGPGDPRLALLKFFQGRRVGASRSNVSSVIWATFRTWNAWRSGERLHKVQIGGGTTSASDSLISIPA